MRGTETIVVHRPLAANRFGEAGGWEADREVTGCIIVPRSESGVDETTFRQQTTIVGVTVYAPPFTDVEPTDQVTARGVRWQVDGEPGDYRSAGGRRKVVAIQLRRVEG